MTARDKWQQHVATALTDWRMFAIGPRPRIEYEQALIRSAIAEVLSLRLQAAYAPIFTTLARIEGKLAVLADGRREPWAPPARILVMPPMAKYDLPEFIRDRRMPINEMPRTGVR